MRVESGKPHATGGWLHFGSDDRTQYDYRPKAHTYRVEFSNSATWDERCRGFTDRITNELSQRLADSLDVSPATLARLRTGWDGQAFTMPLTSVNGGTCGIQRRFLDGKKLSVKGSRCSRAFFLPRGLDYGKKLFICEGASDNATLLDWGFQAVGRYNAKSLGMDFARMLKREGLASVIIVADTGTSNEIQEAIRQANCFAGMMPTRIIFPEAKDVRDWKRQGATRQDVIDLVNRTEVRPVKIVTRIKR